MLQTKPITPIEKLLFNNSPEVLNWRRSVAAVSREHLTWLYCSSGLSPLLPPLQYYVGNTEDWPQHGEVPRHEEKQQWKRHQRDPRARDDVLQRGPWTGECSAQTLETEVQLQTATETAANRGGSFVWVWIWAVRMLSPVSVSINVNQFTRWDCLSLEIPP